MEPPNSGNTLKMMETYKNPEFTASIANDLLIELNNNSDLEEGWNNIHKALEYVKSKYNFF